MKKIIAEWNNFLVEAPAEGEVTLAQITSTVVSGVVDKTPDIENNPMKLFDDDDILNKFVADVAADLKTELLKQRVIIQQRLRAVIAQRGRAATTSAGG